MILYFVVVVFVAGSNFKHLIRVSRGTSNNYFGRMRRILWIVCVLVRVRVCVYQIHVSATGNRISDHSFTWNDPPSHTCIGCVCVSVNDFFYRNSIHLIVSIIFCPDNNNNSSLKFCTNNEHRKWYSIAEWMISVASLLFLCVCVCVMNLIFELEPEYGIHTTMETVRYDDERVCE